MTRANLGGFRTSDASKRIRGQLLVVSAVVVFLVGVAAAYFYLSLPDTGFSYGYGASVGSVDPGGAADRAGLKVGDQVLSVRYEGESFLHPGQEAALLTVRREGTADDGQTIELVIALSSPSTKVTLNRAGYFLIVLGFWLIAVIVLAFKPRNSVAQVFVLGFLLATLGLIVLLLADLGMPWTDMGMNAIVLLLGPLFVYYHTIFPERSDFRGKRVLFAALWATSALLFGISWLFWANKEWFVPVVSVIKAFFALCLLLGMGLLIRTYKVTRSAISKRQIALIALGTAMAILPLIVFILLPQTLPSVRFVTIWPALLALGFFPLSYLYAILRQDLMKLDPVINRTIVYFFLSLAFAALYLSVRLLAPSIFSGPVTLADIVLVMALVFLYEPLKKGIEKLVDSLLYGGWYEHDELVHRTSSALRDALDSRRVAELLVNDVAGTMRFKEAAILLPEVGGDTDTFCVRETKGFDVAQPIGRESSLAATLLEIGEPVEDVVLRGRLLSESTTPEELVTWSEAGAQMWVPLVQQKTIEGILILGNKVADGFFTKEDHHALGTLAHQAAVAIARGELVDRLQGQIHEIQALANQVIALQERNQQRLSQELHDDVVQDLVFVLRLLEEPVEVHSPRKIIGARDVIQQSVDRLRDLMFELRPPSLGDDLEEALSQYVASFRRRRSLRVDFHANGNGGAVPRDVRVALFRICQEGLNNAWKYAEASQVDVRLDLQDHKICLEIEDDGVGFEVPDHLGFLIDQQHLGLVGMRERAEGVGGSFVLESHIGRGTRISVQVPLSAA